MNAIESQHRILFKSYITQGVICQPFLYSAQKYQINNENTLHAIKNTEVNQYGALYLIKPQGDTL